MADATFWKAVLKAVVLPPAGPLLLAVAGLLLLGRSPRRGRVLAWAGVLLLGALSLPIVALALQKLVDRSPALDLESARRAQAIVILGGGIRRDAAEYGGDTLGHLTLERVRYGATVARAVNLPVLVTGGSVFGGEPEATLMRAALEREFGVPVRWAETQSRNTHENAVRSARILAAAHIARIVLVAHSFDMPRAKAEFAAQGIEALPAPTGIPSGRLDTVLDVLPSLAALQGSYYALYEILANAARWILPNVGSATGSEAKTSSSRAAERVLLAQIGVHHKRSFLGHKLSSTVDSREFVRLSDRGPRAAPKMTFPLGWA